MPDFYFDKHTVGSFRQQTHLPNSLDNIKNLTQSRRNMGKICKFQLHQCFLERLTVSHPKFQHITSPPTQDSHHGNPKQGTTIGLPLSFVQPVSRLHLGEKFPGLAVFFGCPKKTGATFMAGSFWVAIW